MVFLIPRKHIKYLHLMDTMMNMRMITHFIFKKTYGK